MITILTVMPNALESASGIGACCACADEPLMSAPRGETTDWGQDSDHCHRKRVARGSAGQPIADRPSDLAERASDTPVRPQAHQTNSWSWTIDPGWW
jgi:hypothetical protein